MRDELPRALFLGSERHDLNGVAACGVIFVEYVYIRLHDVFQRLRALVSGGDKGTFQMDAEKPRARFRSRFAVLLTAFIAARIFSRLCVIVVARNVVVPSPAMVSAIVLSADRVPSMASAPPAPWMCSSMNPGKTVAFSGIEMTSALSALPPILWIFPSKIRLYLFYSLALDVYEAFLKAFIFASSGGASAPR